MNKKLSDKTGASQNPREVGSLETTFNKLAIGQMFRKAYPPNKSESPYQKKTSKKSSQYCNLDGSEIGSHHLQILDLPVFVVTPPADALLLAAIWIRDVVKQRAGDTMWLNMVLDKARAMGRLVSDNEAAMRRLPASQ